jgi:transposase-like protein
MEKHEHDFSWQVCHNEKCPLYMQKDKGNIKLHAHVGINKDIHEIKCARCGTFFSEHKGTPFFGLKTPHDKVMQALKALVEGNGIRATERITGLHRDTVTGVLERAAEHMNNVSAIFLRELDTAEIQFDELWTFVKKRSSRKKVT